MVGKVLYVLFAVLFIVAVSLATLMIVASCGPQPGEPPPTYQMAADGIDADLIFRYGSIYIFRVVDAEWGNVLYVMDGYDSDGLVVVPMEDR